MLKMVFLVHKRPGIDAAEFRRYWREAHGPIAAKIPGLRKYIQNHSIVDSDGTPPAYDGIAELWFDSAEAFGQGLASPEGQAASADAATFMDLDRMQSLSVDEVAIV